MNKLKKVWKMQKENYEDPLFNKDIYVYDAKVEYNESL